MSHNSIQRTTLYWAVTTRPLGILDPMEAGSVQVNVVPPLFNIAELEPGFCRGNFGSFPSGSTSRSAESIDDPST